MTDFRNDSAEAGPTSAASHAGDEISLAWQTQGPQTWSRRPLAPHATVAKGQATRRPWRIYATLAAIGLVAAVLWTLGEAPTHRATATATSAPDEPVAPPAAGQTVTAVRASDSDFRSPLSVVGLGSRQPDVGANAGASTGPAAASFPIRAEPAPFTAAPASGPDIPGGRPAAGDDGSARSRPAQAGGPGSKRATGTRPAESQPSGPRNSQWTATFFGN